MKHLHTLVLALCVAACILACRSLTHGGSAAAGGLVGTAVAGPVGAAGGAAVGSLMSDKIADMLGAEREYTAEDYRDMLTQAHKTIAELQGRKPVAVPVVPTLIRYGIYAAVLWLAFRFRAGLVAFFGSLLTGGGKAALKTAIGLAIGGKAADAAKVATMEHKMVVDARRRMKKSPLKNVVVTESPHP